MGQFQNACTAASTQVDFDKALFFEALQRSHVASGNIHDVDVVPVGQCFRHLV